MPSGAAQATVVVTERRYDQPRRNFIHGFALVAAPPPTITSAASPFPHSPSLNNANYCKLYVHNRARSYMRLVSFSPNHCLPKAESGHQRSATRRQLDYTAIRELSIQGRQDHSGINRAAPADEPHFSPRVSPWYRGTVSRRPYPASLHDFQTGPSALASRVFSCTFHSIWCQFTFWCAHPHRRTTAQPQSFTDLAGTTSPLPRLSYSLPRTST